MVPLVSVKKYCCFLAYSCVLALVLGQLGRWHWFFELFSHFTPWYAIGLILGLWAENRKWWRLVLAVLLSVLVWVSWQGSTTTPTLVLAKTTSERLVSWNVNVQAAQGIQDNEIAILKQADKLFLMEYGRAWDYRLPGDLQQRYRCGLIEDSPFGMAFFSQEVPIKCELKHTDVAKSYPYIRAEFPNYVLYGVHPPPPIHSALASARLAAFSVFSLQIQAETKPVIVMGDFNNTPFSPVFRQFVNNTQLQTVKSNIQSTWQGLLNIDHILVSDNIAYHHSGVMDAMGTSDHRAIFIDLFK